jgi:hypothetical protein
MITTGSKLLIGSAVVATLAAIMYGITQDGVLGTVGLASAAVALAFLAGVNLAIRDSNVLDTDPASVEASAAARVRPNNSLWPFLFGGGAIVLTVGLVTTQVVVTIGLVLLLAAGTEWVVQAWSERTSSDPAHNDEVRIRTLGPLEFPLFGAIAVGILVYAFSRMMLYFTQANTVIFFAVVAGILLIIGFVVAFRPSVRSGAIGGILAVAAVAIIAGGVVTAVDGQREIHEHETVGELSEDGICESPDEFEADENASQTVSASASVAAIHTLDSAGDLSFKKPGQTPDVQQEMTLARSNTSNIIFVNESDHERRLSLDLGTEFVEGEDGEEEEVPFQMCTTLVEEDGEQLLTVLIPVPSSAVPGGYRFFVPGVDSAELNLVVP